MSHAFTCLDCKRRRRCIMPQCVKGSLCIPKCERCARRKPPVVKPKKMKTTSSVGGPPWTPTISVLRDSHLAEHESLYSMLDDPWAKAVFQFGPHSDQQVTVRLLERGDGWGLEIHSNRGTLTIVPNVSNSIFVRPVDHF